MRTTGHRRGGLTAPSFWMATLTLRRVTWFGIYHSARTGAARASLTEANRRDKCKVVAPLLSALEHQLPLDLTETTAV